MAVSGTSSGARVKVTARMITPPWAPSSLLVSFSRTGNPITRIALAPAAVIEWAAPRRKVAVPPGVSRRAAARAVGEATSMISQATAPGDGGPQEPGQAPSEHERGRRDRHPDDRVGHHQRSVPGPLIGAGQHAQQGGVQAEPGQPDAEQATDNQRASTNTRPLHSGELPAITTAAATPIIAGDPQRMGSPSVGTTSAIYRVERTSRVVSCSRPLAAPVTKPNAPQNTPNTEKPLGARSRAAR